MPTLETLPNDIDALFFNGKIVDEANLNAFLYKLGNLLTESLRPKPEEKPSIRMSKIGIPDRKLWFEHNAPMARTQSSNALKFVYGHIIEQLIIFLAKEAGHTVELEQGEVEIDGIKGHQDCKLDGTTVDVKSASSYAFRKFSERTLFKDDPFGYVAQLSAYSHANGGDTAAFVGVNKENGQICILPLERVDQIDPVKRIAQVKAVVQMKEPPEKKCYAAVPYMKSNNLTLNKNCQYCPYHHTCWSDANGGHGLRYFQYASGTVPMVSVVDTPRVQEIHLNEQTVEETVTILEDVLS